MFSRSSSTVQSARYSMQSMTSDIDPRVPAALQLGGRSTLRRPERANGLHGHSQIASGHPQVCQRCRPDSCSPEPTEQFPLLLLAE
jgi:hypothetical protein